MRARFLGLWGLFVSLVFVPFLFSQASNDPPVFRVEEQNVKLFLEPESKLELPISNASRAAVNAHVRLELLNENDLILGSRDVDASVVPGTHKVVVPWAITFQSASGLYWCRLRYRISPSSNDQLVLQEGVVQLGRIIPTLLSLDVAGIKHPRRGAVFPVRVRVNNLRTGKGVSGAVLEARYGDQEKSEVISVHSVKTDAQGYALLSVKVPPDAGSDSEIFVRAQYGLLSASQSLDLDFRYRTALTVSTDKPIYQPGQTLHMRVLALGPDTRAAADRKVKFSLQNEDGEAEFEQEAKTSSFGIASADWEIPAKITLGRYFVFVKMNDDQGSDGEEIRISRYELPKFTVNPVTDKPYYLPGQQPHLDVAATYLFGQPVTRGTVRIVRDNGNHWNSESKTYEGDENEVQHGQLDSSGKFSSTLDLQADFDELRDADYRRYKDIRFAAYVTDLSTNRTEQKHFTVRISKALIHLYLIHAPQVPSESFDMYITAAYPDGTPASVQVAVSAVKPVDNDFPEKPSASDRLQLAHVHTNRYGVARVRANPLSRNLAVTYSIHSQVQLLLEASDSRGGTGVHSELLWMHESQYLHVKPVKRLFLDGETVAADIESSTPDQTLFVDLLARDIVLNSARVQLHHGRAHVEFPYNQDFRGNLYIA